MNKKEIIDKISYLTNINKSECELIYEMTFKVISDYLKKGNNVNILNFGTFKVSNRKPRM